MYMQHPPKPLPSLASRGAKKCMFFGIAGRGPTALFRLDLNWSHDGLCQNPRVFWHHGRILYSYFPIMILSKIRNHLGITKDAWHYAKKRADFGIKVRLVIM